jgi:hypothetical protein
MKINLKPVIKLPIAAEEFISEEEKNLADQIALLKKKKREKKVKPLSEDEPPKPTREPPYIAARVQARKEVIRPWILTVSEVFRDRGMQVDEYHEDFRMDIQSNEPKLGWRICIVELMGDMFSMSIYFDYSVNYALKKVANIEYIEQDQLIQGIDYLLDVLKKFSSKTGKLPSNAIVPIDHTNNDEVEEE